MSAWLVVACPGSRADELERCLGSLRHDPARTTVCTASRHDMLVRPPYGALAVDTEDDFSLARLWNLGLRHAYSEGATEVAVFASDVVGHPGSIMALAYGMRADGCVMAGPNLFGGPSVPDLRALGPRTTHGRVPGGCFMLAAEHRLLCDERYRWWFTDDDLEAQARAIGPVGVYGGTGLALSKPDAGLDTPAKEAWAVEDRAYYVAKWGEEPW